MSTQTEINNALPDNVSGEITANIMRVLLELLTYVRDIIDVPISGGDPTDAELRGVLGTPPVDIVRVVRDSSGGQMFYCAYDATNDKFWTEKLKMST